MIPFRISRVAHTGLYLALILVLAAPQMVLAQNAPRPEFVENQPQTAQTQGAAQSNAAAGNDAPVEAGNGTVTFKPLTALPGIEEAANSTTFPSFLNTIYKLAIGAGAVLAVIMIMIAGVQFMTSRGSVASNEAAKTRLRNALIGLLLVLSPTIVFGIINPSILDLNFGENLSGLKTQELETFTGASGTFRGADTYLFENMSVFTANDNKRCTDAGGVLSFECRKKDESGGKVSTLLGTCAPDENKYNVCKKTGSQPTTIDQCRADYTSIQSVPISGASSAGQQCSSDRGFQTIPHGCCAGASPAGNLCCAKPKGSENFSFQLAYYYTEYRESTKRSCYFPNVRKYTSKSDCETQLDLLKKGTISGGKPLNGLTFTSSCTFAAEAVTPAPAGLEKCIQ